MVKSIILWFVRSILVGVAYIIGLMIAGGFFSALGVQFANADQSAVMLPWFFVDGIVIGLVLGPFVSQLEAKRMRQVIIWTCVLFFNLASVVIEGAFFAPTRIGNNLPALIAQQLFLAVFTAVALTLFFKLRSNEAIILPPREWHDWLWRLVVSATSYPLFYFIFGAINYSLVTKPYYDVHAGGLDTPSPEIILAAEIIRGVLIVFSVLPFLLTVTKPKWERAVWTGIILFAIGGVVPLLYQVNALPTFLLVASGVEIFFQNFSTGIVMGLLLGRTVQARI